MFDVNLVAVLVAAVANFVIGFMFHGPLFGKTWMRLANVTPTGNEKFSDMYGQMFWNLVSNFVAAFVLALLFSLITSKENIYSFFAPVNGDVMCGLIVAFWLWLGFIVTSSSAEVIWMKRSTKLWIFEMFSSLVAMLAMGAIIAAW